MTTPENRITDICIIEKPVHYYQPSGPKEITIEVYRCGTIKPAGKYRCYKNPTAASLRRVKRFIPPATQRMTRYESENGWKIEKTWAADRPEYRREWNPTLGKYYIDLRFW